MVTYSNLVTRQSTALSRLVSLSRSQPFHTARLHANPVQISEFRSSSLSQNPAFSLNSGRSSVLKGLGRVGIGFERVGFDRVRFSAVSDSGSGGSGGHGGSGDGSYGGRGEGDSSGGGSGRNWSLLSWNLRSVTMLEMPYTEDNELLLLAGVVASLITYWHWYLTQLAEYPVLTKAVTSAVLTFLGDLICQLLIDQAPSLDLKRNFLFTFLGLALVGPTLHFWYLYLSRLITVPGASGAFMRLLLDQFIFAPLFIGVFLAAVVTLEGRPSEVVPKLQQEWFSAVLANWKLWIPFQFLNFRFVPQQFQVLAANVVALAWNVILSFKAHKEILHK